MEAEDVLAETTDAVLGGRLMLRQPRDGYRVAIDPIFLAAACPAQPGETVADLGCGVGTAALCIARRVPDLRCSGVDLQAPLIALARGNAVGNGLADRVSFVAGDILDPALALYAARVDHVVANPPYLPRDRATASSNPIKAMANVEGEAGLAAWVAAAARTVKPGGTATFIHRADRLPELLTEMAPRFGALAILPLHPKADAAARRVLVCGRAGQRGPAALLPGFVLHEADGAFTAAAQAILRDAAFLPLSAA